MKENWIRIDSEINQKWVRNESENASDMSQNWVRNEWEMTQKWIRNASEAEAEAEVEAEAEASASALKGLQTFLFCFLL